MSATIADVEEIYDGEVIQPHVDAAVQITDRALADCDYAEEELDEIQRWLAAHVAASAKDDEAGVTRIRQGPREVQKASAAFGEGLKSTRYGQMALALDTCGGLASLSKRAATMNVL